MKIFVTTINGDYRIISDISHAELNKLMLSQGIIKIPTTEGSLYLNLEHLISMRSYV